MRFAPAVLLIVSLLLARGARADLSESAFPTMPPRFSTDSFTLSGRGLGGICYSRDLMPDGSACNPAFSDEVKQGFLMARVYIGNGYTALNTANQLIFQPVSQGFLQNLFQNQSVTTVEGSASIVFGTQYFSAEFTPYRVQYFSSVQNPNMPVIALQAAVDRELDFQGGAPLGGISPSLKDVSVGGKLRLTNSSFISGTFSLADTLTSSAAANPQSLLPVQTQFSAYFDPTIGWRPEIGRWKLWVSAGAVNLGSTTTASPLYQVSPDADLGVGVEPPLKYGRLRLGLDMVNLFNNGGDLASIPRLGSSYKIGILEAMAGINENMVTAGLMFGFQIIQAGIVYEYLHSDLDGGYTNNQISTEASIRL